MNLTSSKIAKHVDVLKLFVSIALRIERLKYFYDVTTHCCETLAQTLPMWWAMDHLHFPLVPSFLVRNNSVYIAFLNEQDSI